MNYNGGGGLGALTPARAVAKHFQGKLGIRNVSARGALVDMLRGVEVR